MKFQFFALLVAFATLVGCSNDQQQQTGPAPRNPGAAAPSGGDAQPLSPRDINRARYQVRGYVGGEKMMLLENPRIQRILLTRYDMVVHPHKAGSIEMVTTMDYSQQDFLWPSNDVAVELFKLHGGRPKKDEIIFNSPIVIYTGWDIVNALIKEGIVTKRQEGYYIAHFDKLLTMIVEKKQWKDLGLPLYGDVTVRSTDPTKSNSGNMFAGLVANMLNEGQVVSQDTVRDVLPDLRTFFERLGMMEHSSGDIFRKFVSTGINNSMVVGYENQCVEFILANPRSRTLIKDSICILYPEPTVWSSHPIISLNENGNLLIEAMMDEEIQRIAWSEHGFRSGLPGVNVDVSSVSVNVPERITSVMPLPNADAMDRIIRELESL